MTIDVSHERSAPAHRATLGWAVRRALIGLVILTVVVSGAAWLLYAAIEAETASAQQAPPAVSLQN